MSKIYCKNCKYISGDKTVIWLCNYPGNIEYRDNWLERRMNHKQMPMKMNKDNNCKWFKNK